MHRLIRKKHSTFIQILINHKKLRSYIRNAEAFMVNKNNILFIIFTSLFLIINITPSFAEIKVFEKQVEETISRGQSQDQVEAFALQKAKRLAVEEAGTYISSLSVVQNYKLQKDEVTALASGIVQAKIIGIPSIRIDNKIVYVKVKARIDVDTFILDRQIQEIMKEKGTLKILEAERKKNKELEEKLANLKSSEVKRLEELNAQALALERERDKQSLFRKEQALKAKGELSKVEAQRLAKERELQERISKTLAEQEKAKLEEAMALEAEQDRIKRAQLENEQRWNDLARKAQLSQDQWVTIDDSLSMKQALNEVKDLKKEVANLKSRLDFQYQENRKNLQAAYDQQLLLVSNNFANSILEKDPFETNDEYKKRVTTHKAKLNQMKRENRTIVRRLEIEKKRKLSETEVQYLEHQLKILEPFINRLKAIQDRKFTLPEGGAVTVELEFPDAEKSRFPMRLQYNGQSWSVWWPYTDRNAAKDFYKTRIYIKASGLFQLGEWPESAYKLTAVRIIHQGTNEEWEIQLEQPLEYTEISRFAETRESVEVAKKLMDIDDAEKIDLGYIEFSGKSLSESGFFILIEADNDEKAWDIINISRTRMPRNRDTQEIIFVMLENDKVIHAEPAYVIPKENTGLTLKPWASPWECDALYNYKKKSDYHPCHSRLTMVQAGKSFAKNVIAVVYTLGLAAGTFRVIDKNKVNDIIEDIDIPNAIKKWRLDNE